MKSVIVTSGVDSEYVLCKAAAFARSRGYEVFEFDFGRIDRDVTQDLSYLRTFNPVYITSCHTNLTYRVARQIFPQLVLRYPYYKSPLEIIPILCPRKSIYVPHDLLAPFGEENLDEFRYLDVYDHVFSPYNAAHDYPVLYERCSITNVGWIKKSKDIIVRERSDQEVTFFVSSVEHLLGRFGEEGLVDYFRPILQPGVRVKLPKWRGVIAIEKLISETTRATVIDADCSSADLIATSDIVLCNGVSSIIAESCLDGVLTVFIADDEIEDAEVKMSRLSRFPGLIFHDYRNRLPIDVDWLMSQVNTARESKLNGFDFEAMLKIIDDRS